MNNFGTAAASLFESAAEALCRQTPAARNPSANAPAAHIAVIGSGFLK
ncbi:MAG: hypothetical protein QM741_08520 [Rudaea sp.]